MSIFPSSNNMTAGFPTSSSSPVTSNMTVVFPCDSVSSSSSGSSGYSSSQRTREGEEVEDATPHR